jgi:hypothetical protein
MAGKNQQKKQDLDDELNQIENQHKSIDITKYMVNSDEDMPGFGEVELYNYDQDIEKSKEIGKRIISDLVDLYLSDAPSVKEHPYIKSRMDEDAEYYSQMKTIQKLSEKLLLQQMRQIDAGDSSPRMYEITSKHIGEIRENIKDGRNARMEIEKMYKEMRKDLGLNDTVNNDDYKSESEDDKGIIMDGSSINSRIEDYLKNKNTED